MKLPINTHPLLLARDPEAYIFAMMTAKDEKALPFLLSRFISVAAYNDTSKTEAVVGYNNNYVDYYLWRSGKLRLDTVQIPNDVAYDGLAVTGVMKSDTEPTFASDLLVWNGKYYSIGVGHKEFSGGYRYSLRAFAGSGDNENNGYSMAGRQSDILATGARVQSERGYLRRAGAI